MNFAKEFRKKTAWLLALSASFDWLKHSCLKSELPLPQKKISKKKLVIVHGYKKP